MFGFPYPFLPSKPPPTPETSDAASRMHAVMSARGGAAPDHAMMKLSSRTATTCPAPPPSRAPSENEWVGVE